MGIDLIGDEFSSGPRRGLDFVGDEFGDEFTSGPRRALDVIKEESVSGS